MAKQTEKARIVKTKFCSKQELTQNYTLLQKMKEPLSNFHLGINLI